MARFVDLTLTVKPGTRGVAFEPKYNFAQHGWNAQTLSLYSHSGTHMDAPLHFEASEQTVDEIPLDRCLGPAWVAKLDGIAPRTSIKVEHLGDIEERLQPGDLSSQTLARFRLRSPRVHPGGSFTFDLATRAREDAPDKPQRCPPPAGTVEVCRGRPHA